MTRSIAVTGGPGTVRRPVSRAPLALARGAAFGLFSVAGAVLAVLAVLSMLLWVGLGLFPLFLGLSGLVRRFADWARELAGRWSGIPIASPYQPRPGLERTQHGWWWSGHDYHKRRWFAALSLRVRWVWTDPATWRDLAWLVSDPVVGGVLGLLPAALLLSGAGGIGLSVAWALGHTAVHAGLSQSTGGSGLAAVLGIGLVAAGFATAEPLLRLHGQWTELLLRPSRRAKLRDRIAAIIETRAYALADQAAELRRIERDLHDGAQARLVAMRMTLAALSPLIEQDPERAKAVVDDLRDSSAKVLQELRDLVHGIHPPVLAERGVGDALRAFVLDLPLEVTADIDLPGRFEPAVEAALYFSCCEALTNVVKHADTRTASIRIRYVWGRLQAAVVDEGCGGADLDKGSGLRGVQRRLAAFDGSLHVISRPGGPTRVSMEIPCALCSPKTSPC